MRIRILAVGDNPAYIMTEAEVLKQRGIQVYTCFNKENLDAMITEIKPDVIYIDPQQPNIASTMLYNNLLDHVSYCRIPLIYTLSEDDVYLVNGSRLTAKGRRNMIADNMIDAIKLALGTTSQTEMYPQTQQLDLQFRNYNRA